MRENIFGASTVQTKNFTKYVPTDEITRIQKTIKERKMFTSGSKYDPKYMSLVKLKM